MKKTTTIDTIVGFGIVAFILFAPYAAHAISLNPATDVVPRIFSPNGDGINDGVYFQLTNPTQSQISGIVLDMSGAKVAEINLSPSGEADRYYWNGRDDSGDVVPAGPYVYRIDGEGAIVSGVVVVAR
jgi:hypothetical protein